MIENTSTLYKMIILYMLKKVTFPLSNSQITNFLGHLLSCSHHSRFCRE